MTREMASTATCSDHTRVRRYCVDLQAIQELCEINYAQLLKIAGETICRKVGNTLSLTAESLPEIRLTIQEQTRYTTVISLMPETEQTRWDKQPHLVIRLYHDVHMAEVVAANQYRNLAICYNYPNPHMHQPDEKYQVNRLLTEWLLLY